MLIKGAVVMIQECLLSGKNHRKEVEQYTYKSIKVETYGIEYSDCRIAKFIAG